VLKFLVRPIKNCTQENKNILSIIKPFLILSAIAYFIVLRPIHVEVKMKNFLIIFSQEEKRLKQFRLCNRPKECLAEISFFLFKTAESYTHFAL